MRSISNAQIDKDRNELKSPNDTSNTAQSQQATSRTRNSFVFGKSVIISFVIITH